MSAFGFSSLSFSLLAFALFITGVIRAESLHSESITSVQTPTSTAGAPKATHTIQVGNDDNKFKPDVTTAGVGDIVEFAFYPANHSVVRAEYTFPCIPYEMTGESKTGFFSGFHPIDKITNNLPTYQITINNTDPIFFYCSFPNSCIHYGMVGAINPNSTTNISVQRSMAMDSAFMLQPGDPFPDEAHPPSDSNPTSTAPAVVGNGTTIPWHPRPSSGGAGTGLKPAAIAGIVVGVTVVVALAVSLCFFIGRARTLKEEVKRKDSTVTRRRNWDSMALFGLSGFPGAGDSEGHDESKMVMNQVTVGVDGNHNLALPQGNRGGEAAPSALNFPYPALIRHSSHPSTASGLPLLNPSPYPPTRTESLKSHPPASSFSSSESATPSHDAREPYLFRSSSLRAHTHGPSTSAPPSRSTTQRSAPASTMLNRAGSRSSGGVFEMGPTGVYVRSLVADGDESGGIAELGDGRRTWVGGDGIFQLDASPSRVSPSAEGSKGTGQAF